MQNGKMVIFDSAHNEYLHYLVTIGFAGMASYIVFYDVFCCGYGKANERAAGRCGGYAGLF